MRVKGKGIICLFLAALLMVSASCGKKEESNPSESSADGENISTESSENSGDGENSSGEGGENGDGEDSSGESGENGDGEDSSGESSENGGDENSSNESSENGDAENSSSESGENGDDEEDIVLGYKFDVGSNWKLAYADTDYLYYYMMETSDTYDSNVVLSVTSDTGLASVKLSELEKSLESQYGDNAVIEQGTTKENGESMIYIELEQVNGGVTARIGQYIVVGEEKAVIFSVYSEESKFETAKKYAGYVVNTISFEK